MTRGTARIIPAEILHFGVTMITTVQTLRGGINMAGYTDRKRYMKDKYNCDLMMIEGVELVPLYQIIDRLEQSVSLDEIRWAREEIAKGWYTRPENAYEEGKKDRSLQCMHIIDTLIAGRKE